MDLLFDEIDKTVDDVRAQNENPSDPVWEEDPIDFDSFVSDAYHMGQPPLSEIQRRDVQKLLGDDPKKIFSGGSEANVAVLLWGKGSGKDWICSLIQAYVTYVLLCMRNPSSYFGLAPRETVDCINVSISKDHAKKVYYKKFKDKLLHWPWLRERYSLYESNKLVIADGNKSGKPRVQLNDGEVEFPDKMVRAISHGADAERSEGFQPVFWLMDEASAFKDHTDSMNGDKVYKTLRSSAKSRYGLKWKGMIISYPREKHDFTMRMHELAEKHGIDSEDTEDGKLVRMFGSRHMTWEVRPPGSFSAATFEFEGMMIPVDFQEEFETNPEDSKQKYCCLPPEVESKFITYQERIIECVMPNKSPLFTTEIIEVLHSLKESNETKRYTGRRIDFFFDKSLESRKLPRVIHVDGGLKKDNAGLVMAHGEPMEILVRDEYGRMVKSYRYKVVVDAVITWRPDKKRGLQVSFNNIESLILELSETYRIAKVSYDQWNSQSSLEMLQSRNIAAEEHTIRNEDYFELRTMIYQHAVQLLPQVYEFGGKPYENKDASLLFDELTRLKWVNERVDHPKDFSKDVADCLAGVNRLLNHPKEKNTTRRVMPRSTMGPAIVRSGGMPFSASQSGITQDIPVMPGLPKMSTPQTGQIMPGYSRWSGAEDGVVPGPAQMGPMGRRFPRPVLHGSGSGRFFSGLNQTDIPRHLSR